MEAIILHEQTNSGKTIIEKILAYTDVGFGIVIYTPCDFGIAKNDIGTNNDTSKARPRARQNVIFEHVYLIGKLGCEKVCALLHGTNIEVPGDLSGVVYVNKNDGNSWKYEIAKEMKAVGYEIDMNKIK